MQQQFVMVEQTEFNKLIQTIESLVNSIQSNTQPSSKKISKSEQVDQDIDYYIPLQKGLAKMGITPNQWYKKYQKIIKHKPFGHSTWIDCKFRLN